MLLLCCAKIVVRSGRWYSGRVSQTFQNRIDAVVKSYGDTDALSVSRAIEWQNERERGGGRERENESFLGLHGTCMNLCLVWQAFARM